MTTGMSSPIVLCCKWKRPPFCAMTVRDLRSCVEEVTDAHRLSFGSFSMMMRFFESCSWMRTTFSVPFTMKYPPGSNGHSFTSSSSRSVLPRSRHLAERSMMGMRPIMRPRCVTMELPFV